MNYKITKIVDTSDRNGSLFNKVLILFRFRIKKSCSGLPKQLLEKSYCK